jgi:hypothetical protein
VFAAVGACLVFGRSGIILDRGRGHYPMVRFACAHEAYGVSAGIGRSGGN